MFKIRKIKSELNKSERLCTAKPKQEELPYTKTLKNSVAIYLDSVDISLIMNNCEIPSNFFYKYLSLSKLLISVELFVSSSKLLK